MKIPNFIFYHTVNYKKFSFVFFLPFLIEFNCVIKKLFDYEIFLFII